MDHIEKQKTLIKQAKDGDSRAFDELYNMLYKPLFAFVFYKTRNNELSKDVCQEVFISWYKSLNTYKMTIKLENYLFLIATRLIINHSKKNTIEQLTDYQESLLIDESSKDIESLLIYKYDFEKIKSLMSELSSDQENVLILKYMLDKDNSEIADILDKNKDNIRQIEYRALSRLNTLYKEKYEK